MRSIDEMKMNRLFSLDFVYIYMCIVYTVAGATARLRISLIVYFIVERKKRKYTIEQ